MPRRSRSSEPSAAWGGSRSHGLQPRSHPGLTQPFLAPARGWVWWAHTLVDQFNFSPDITVFLLSMAGSSGINLTKPDTVIFYDHDWNPANDAQAMDRAYRIGQKKDVTVYRLVSKGTIEERILERQRAKQSLADEVIGADAAGFKDLTKEELVGLFRLDSGDQNGL